MKKYPYTVLIAVLAAWLLVPALAAGDQTQDIGTPRWVIDDVLTSDIVPFAIGHRGYGANLGEDPDRPIENTTKSVRAAFREGVQIVEVDANLTADGVAVALHDDFFLSDFTCVNSYTFEQLQEMLTDVSSVRQILKVARTYSVITDPDRPSGQVVVEIKTPSPHCVSREAEPFVLQELVEAVLEDIRFTRMADQVTIESYSPEILALVAAGAPDIPRMLAMDAAQLLPLEDIQQIPGYEVQIIEDKTLFGLTWGEIGIQTPYGTLWVYRLPGYFTEAPGGAFGNYINTLFATGSSIASLDKNILFLATPPPNLPDPADAGLLVGALHSYGFQVLVFTIDFTNPYFNEWMFMSLAGVDGMYVDDIPMGLMMEGQ